MAINVLCPGCKARFTVSEKFAGKKGPCPKCKTQITIPEAAPEIKVHAPEAFGPKTAEGKGVLQPIFREEKEFSPVVAAGIGGAVVVVFLLALIMRFNYPKEADKIDFPILFLAIGAVLLAPPLAWGGYTFLRDQELEPYRGQALWMRVGACAAIYAAIWGLLWGLVTYLGLDDLTKEIWFIAAAFMPMLLLGAGGAFVTLDLPYLSGIFHYGLYLLVTVLLRLVIGLAPLIGPFKD
jgi:hypothetical protein